MPDAISIGPAAIPPQVIAALLSLAAGALVFRLIGRSSPAIRSELSLLGDRIFNSLVIAFIVWKVTPLFFWWEAILDEPVRLLRLPGGRWGVVAGSIVFLALVIPRLWQNTRLIRPAAVGAFSVVVSYAIAVAALSALGATTTSPPSTEILRIRAPELAGTPVGTITREERLIPGDRPAIVTFWATWCGPCHAEIPVKREAYDIHGNDVRMVAVNMTHTESGPDAVAAYARENRLNYPVVLDRNGAISALFGVRGTPTTVVLSADGEVVDRWMGPSDLGRINRAVERAGTDARAQAAP